MIMTINQLEKLIKYLNTNEISLYEKIIFIHKNEDLKNKLLEIYWDHPLTDKKWINRAQYYGWIALSVAGYIVVMVDHFASDCFWIAKQSNIKDDWDLSYINYHMGVHISFIDELYKVLFGEESKYTKDRLMALISLQLNNSTGAPIKN